MSSSARGTGLNSGVLGGRELTSVGLVLLVLLGSLLCVGEAMAQPPGTLPPASVLNPEATPANPASKVADAVPKEEAKVEPKAFLMLDSAGNPVMVPGMTFEKLDQLMRLESGLERPEKPYVIDSLSIAGRAGDNHADLNVTVRLTVEETGDAWVSIPLRMGNFHRTGLDVSGIENYRLDLSSDGSGYVLHLQSDSRRTVVLAMRVVVRVSAPPTAAIEFRLPETVCEISLRVPQAGVTASVLGRGDEVVRAEKSGPDTEVKVDSGGGTFSLRFGSQGPVVDDRPVLEAESRIVVDWQQADNSPLAKVDLTVRNLRGDLPKVSLTVPDSLQLLQQPEVLNGSPFEVVDAVDTDPTSSASAKPGAAASGSRRLELIPQATRGDSRVELSLDGQMRSEGGRAGGMVLVAPVGLENAIQTGEIEVRTPRDFRLRWTSHPWVRSVWEKSDSEPLASRVYRFRFDRVPFELPIWLSARARQLRIESEQRMTLYDSLASLRMILRTTGNAPDSRILPIEVGPWTVKSVFLADTTTLVEADRVGNSVEIDLSSLPSGGSEGDRIEVVLVHPLVPGESKLELPLPRIVGGEGTIGALPSTVTVVSQNESRFVIDLPNSLGIGEVIRRGLPAGTSPSTGEESLDESRYSLPDLAQPSRLVGYLVRERPTVSIQADAEVSIIADRVTEVIDWTVYPQGNLRGRLPIAWGETAKPGESAENTSLTSSPGESKTQAAKTEATNEAEELAAALHLSPLAAWSVTVDDSPATVRLDVNGRYQVYSDRLNGGPHRIRFRRTRALPSMPTSASTIHGVYLPRPTLADVTLRGPVVVRLRGSSQWDLATLDQEGRPVDEFSLTSLPEKSLTIQLKPIEKRENDFIIRRGVLRTAVGQATQHEQLLAMIEGGGVLRIALAGAGANVLARATVDGVPAEVLRDSSNRCVIRIGESGIHRLDFQVWIPRRTPQMITEIQPALMVPIGVERLYWQIIVPQSEHLVWATPTMGRAMSWQLDRLRLQRVPLESDTELVAWSGVETDAFMPPGNRYLLVGVDSGSLAAKTMSRAMMWLLVAAVVLLVSGVLIYWPASRHPMTVVIGIVMLAGLLITLPDAAVLCGQLMLVAMLIVAVMSGVRQLLISRRSDRLFVPTVTENPTTRNVTASHHERPEPYVSDPDPALAAGSVADSRS